MEHGNTLLCDGCGQSASAEHIAQRLKRLEWATRFRPVHIQVLVLAAAAPEAPEEFVYSPDGPFRGEAAALLSLANIAVREKAKEAVQAEFQRAGFFATYVLECPVDRQPAVSDALPQLLKSRAPATLARVRRSLKPKRVVLLSPLLNDLVGEFSEERMGCPVILEEGRPFSLGGDIARTLERMQNALAQPVRRG